MENEKTIYWVGTSYKDLLKFPSGAKRDAGYQLHRIQNGLDPEDWKPFKTVGAGVKEIRIRTSNNSFRIMYVTKLHGKIYILHAFQKKTQQTKLHDINIAKIRYNELLKKEPK